MELSRRIVVLNHVKDDTESKLASNNLSDIGIDALTLSLDLDLHRSNVSMELNKLWKSGHLVKIQGRPTLFFDQALFERKFPNTYIPSYITLHESILDYIDSRSDTTATDQTQKETLTPEMISALSAIAYPPHGLPLLIHGDEGTGKMTFVHDVIEKSKQNGILQRNLRIKYINCSDDVSLNEISSDRSRNTLFVLQNPELLQKRNIEQLIDVSTSHGTTQNKFPQHLIIVTTSTPSQDFAESLYKITPINVYLPNLEEISPLEKLKIIAEVFMNEANSIMMNISVNINLFIAFCEHVYKYNYNSVYSEVQNSIALAHYRSRQSSNNTVSITFEDLSRNMRTNQAENKHKFEYSLLFSDFNEEYVFFTRGGGSNIDEIMLSGSDELEYALKSFKSNFKTNGSTLKYDFKTLSELYFSFNPLNEDSILAKNHSHKLGKLKSLIREIPEFSELSRDDLYIFILYCYILSLNTLSSKSEPTDNEFLKHLTEANILNDSLKNTSTQSIIDTVMVELLNTAKSKNPQLIIVIDNRIQAGIYESILSQLQEENYYIHYADRNLSSLEIKRDIDQIILNKMRPIDTLIVTDIYKVFRNRITLKDSLSISMEVVYPLSLPLLDKCVSNLKSGYTVNDFKEINNQSFESKDLNTQNVANLENNEFIDKLNTTILARDLSFIDSRKTTPLLTEALETIARQLSISLSKNLIVKFIVHCSFMIERVIKNESIIHPNLKEHYRNDSKVINIIKMNFNKTEASFGITIPPMEIAYIADIFIPLIETSKIKP